MKIELSEYERRGLLAACCLWIKVCEDKSKEGEGTEHEALSCVVMQSIVGRLRAAEEESSDED